MTEKENKPKRKSNGKNSPVIGDNGLMVEPGDNAKYIKNAMELGALPKIDLMNPEAVEDRINEFFKIQFENDLKPTVSGMGMALGLSRQRLWEIKTDNLKGGISEWKLPKASLDAIKKGYNYMEILWENYMQNGKYNPVTGIFLGKNNFGYQDKQEMVLTPNTNQEAEYDINDIKKRLSADNSTLLIAESDSED